MVNYHKTWRIINSGHCSASYNMALDEAVAIYVREGGSLPTLRLYAWDRPSLSLGCFQKVRDLNIEYCREEDIPIVRRPTGGRAILHDKELTYSFSIRTDNEAFSKGIFDSYKKISAALRLALAKIGLAPTVKMERKTPNNYSPLCFQSTSYGEITINDRKVLGSAQKRWPDGLLQQGSIPYSFEESLIQKIFKFHDMESVKTKMTGLKNVIPELKDEEFREVIKVSFEETFDIEFIQDVPLEEEGDLALRLESEKYLSSEWNLRQ